MIRKVILTGILATTMMTSSALAQMVCSERTKFLKHLGEGYSEAPVSMGLASNGSVLEVLASQKGTWTIILTMPSGKSCVVASGEAWENVDQKLALGPKT